MNRIYILVAVVAVLIVFGMVGNADYNDEKAYQAYSCDMVKMGAWPKSFCE